MQSAKRIFLFAVTCALMLSMSNVKSIAQKIGVVDGNTVLNNFDEAKKADEKIKAQQKIWSDSLQMMQKSAQDKADAYKKILSTMSDDAKAKAEAEVNTMAQNLQNYNNMKFNQQDGELAKMRQELVKPILDKIKSAVDQVAKKKKLDVILDKGNVVYVAEGVTDITSDVEKALK